MTLPQWWYDELRSLAERSRQVVLLAALTGAVTGLAVAFYEWLLVEVLIETVLSAPIWAQALIPAVGLALAAVILRYVGPNATPATSDEYIKSFHDPGYSLPLRRGVARVLASISTLGSGGALGLEGPSIYMGATIGSLIHNRLPPKFRGNKRTLLVAGAAAGIAAIFKAPATGAVFALESPFRDDLGRRSLLPALVAAVTGYLVFVTIEDTTPLLAIEGVRGFEGKNLAAAAAVGVLAGVGARGFSAAIRFAKKYAAETNPALRVLVASSLMIASFAVVRPLTGESLTLENGLGVIRWALDPNLAVWLLVVVFGLRMIATTASVAGGGVGGLFIPLVVAGALLGRAVGGVVNSPQESLYVVVGIAAFLSAGYRVPLAAIMFVAETTGRPSFVVPGVIAAVAAELAAGQSSITAYQRAPDYLGTTSPDR
ncbi:MAG: chloride channel protein [Microthrixaceae bacterium]|nr:chloride channel protein [Microthrixaceae bacterium]MCB1010180.1 chloride channel protein [Microthrixaceae bacterium]MCB9387157.1 chloride channel protein [Microthrixaceae bacterium]MCO5321736.1 chloride channel protein [Microthrixaceae bacterium]